MKEMKKKALVDGKSDPRIWIGIGDEYGLKGKILGGLPS